MDASLAPAPPHGDLGGMERPPVLSPNRLLAAWPIPVRVLVGLGLLALCAWLPSAIALFR